MPLSTSTSLISPNNMQLSNFFLKALFYSFSLKSSIRNIFSPSSSQVEFICETSEAYDMQTLELLLKKAKDTLFGFEKREQFVSMRLSFYKQLVLETKKNKKKRNIVDESKNHNNMQKEEEWLRNVEEMHKLIFLGVAKMRRNITDLEKRKEKLWRKEQGGRELLVFRAWSC